MNKLKPINENLPLSSRDTARFLNAYAEMINSINRSIKMLGAAFTVMTEQMSETNKAVSKLADLIKKHITADGEGL